MKAKETKEYTASTRVTLSNGIEITVEETCEMIMDLCHDPIGASANLVMLTQIITLTDYYSNTSYLHEPVYVSVNHIVITRPIL